MSGLNRIRKSEGEGKAKEMELRMCEILVVAMR